MYKKVLIFCLVSFYSCNNDNGFIPIIDLIEATRKDLYMSDIFENIEYVCLETKQECLLDEEIKLFLSEKYIIASWFKTQSVYLFDRKSGSFIKQIGRRGKGPNEYNSLIPMSVYDEKNQIFYFDCINKWMGIQIETDKSIFIEKPYELNTSIMGKIEVCAVTNFLELDTNRYIGYVNNVTGIDKTVLVVFDQNGIIQKRFPNYQTYTNHKPNAIPANGGHFYQFKGSDYFKEFEYNDTIFKVTSDSINPHIIFYLGNMRPPYHLRESEQFDMQNYYSINFIGECVEYVLFNFWYKREHFSGYYDKTGKKTFISNNKNGKSYFINDIDDILYFYPKYMNQKGEFCGVLSAQEVAAYITRKNVINPKLQHLSSIKDDDNPIVIIATPRKQ